MTYRLEFTLDGLPATTNSGNRAHWAIKVREANYWKCMVRYQVLMLKKRPARPLKKAKLTLTRCSAVQPDFDGLVSSFKHPIDGLKAAGVIVDDKMSCIGQPNYQWEKAPPKKGFIRILVESVPDEETL